MVVLAILAIAAGDAVASPAGMVPSAGDEGDPADLHLFVDYEYSVQGSSIYREEVGGDIDPLAPIPRQRDLSFKQFRHVLTPRADLGIYHDTWVSFAIPITLNQVRELQLDDGVARDASSTAIDGILPMEGFDARNPTNTPPGNFMFRSHERKGIDQVHMGLGVAPMNQQKDDTKPTWKLGGELLLPAGRVMRFNRMDPSSESGVASGVYELRFWTSVAKRTQYVEGWYHMFYQVPIATSKYSLYDDDPKFGSRNLMPGQKAGASAGLELIPIEDHITGNRLTIDLGARVVGHFEGRGYTELWEVFAYAGDARFDGPLAFDNDPINAGPQLQSHPGITNYENYLETAGKFAITAKLGRHLELAAMVDLVWKTDHLITFTDAGVDHPTCGTGGSPCEDEDNVVVNPGTNEVNPLHVPLVDLVGHRYVSENNFDFTLGVQARILY